MPFVTGWYPEKVFIASSLVSRLAKEEKAWKSVLLVDTKYSVVDALRRACQSVNEQLCWKFIRERSLNVVASKLIRCLIQFQVLTPSSGFLDFAISMRPDYHQAIIDTIRFYGWDKITYLYDSHDGEWIYDIIRSIFLLSRCYLWVHLFL